MKSNGPAPVRCYAVYQALGCPVTNIKKEYWHLQQHLFGHPLYPTHYAARLVKTPNKGVSVDVDPHALELAWQQHVAQSSAIAATTVSDHLAKQLAGLEFHVRCCGCGTKFAQLEGALPEVLRRIGLASTRHHTRSRGAVGSMPSSRWNSPAKSRLYVSPSLTMPNSCASWRAAPPGAGTGRTCACG